MKKRTLLAALIPSLFASIGFSQTIHGTGKGLDALDESEVESMLSDLKLNALLERDFANFKVAAADQAQVSLTPMLKQLAEAGNMKVAARRALAVKVAAGLDGQMGKETDPEAAMSHANLLFNTVLQTQTEMEFFGENAIAENQLKPVVETDRKMFQRAGKLANDEANKIGNQVKNAAQFQKVQPQLDHLHSNETAAEYYDDFAAYPHTLALPEGDPFRKTIADAAILKLKDYDNNDSGVQSRTRLQIGKLYLSEGNYVEAQKAFDSIVNNPNKEIAPPPDFSQQNLGRYFSIIADIKQRKLRAVETEIPTYEEWQKTNFLPSLNAAGQLQIKEMMSMLKFRLYSAQSDLANAADTKKALNDKAMNLLSELIKEDPDRKDLVFDQLVARVPADAPLASLNPLILQGRREIGFGEIKRPEDQKADPQKLQLAIEASRELMARNDPAIDKTDKDLSAYFIGYAYDRLSQPKQAAAAFLDYATKPDANKAKGWNETALDRAQDDILALRKKDPSDPDTRELYDRFLPVAIAPPFNRKVWAFRYASLLLQEGKYKEAADYFKMVEPTDKLFSESQYDLLLAMFYELSDTSLAADARKAIANQVIELATKVDGYLTSASTDADKQTWAKRVERADTKAAELARRELRDPAKTLQIMDGFENRIAPAKDPNGKVEAMGIRINAYVDQGKIEEATKTLFDLLAVDEAQGQSLMFRVKDTIVADMATAKTSGNVEEQRKLALDLANVSTVMLKWASDSKDPKVTADLPKYQSFSADSKRMAAELVDDPKVKQQQLNLAMADYRTMLQQHPDDPGAQLGIGLTAYDLKDYAEAIKQLAPLVNGKKLGAAFTTKGEPGTEQEVENVDFWEANYKLIKSMVEQAKQTPADPKSAQSMKDAKMYVETLYITYGKRAGGTTYRADYEELKKELGGK